MATQQLTRIYFKKDFDFTVTAKASYKAQKHDFKSKNITDSEYDFDEKEILEGIKDYVLFFSKDLMKMHRGFPMYGSQGAFWVMTVIGLGWFIRIQLTLNSRRVVFKFKKLFFN